MAFGHCRVVLLALLKAHGEKAEALQIVQVWRNVCAGRADDINVNREAMSRLSQDKHQRRAALETEGAAGQFQHLQQG